MTLLPVIARELRAQSRQPFTYWVRVLGAGALLATMFISFVDIENGTGLGSRYFAILHRVLFFAIWILVPMMTADCISRERRENTLGLLFLTKLKPTDIVLAKSFVHGLRALTLCVAVLPVFTICFLMGGVSWKEVLLSGMMNFCSLCWALAAGIVGSSQAKIWTRAMLAAEVWAAGFGLLFVALHGYWVIGALWPATRPFPNLELILQESLILMTNSGGWWPEILAGPTSIQSQWLIRAGIVSATSLLGLCAVIFVAAINLRRNWKERSRSAFEAWCDQVFCTPVVFLSLFKRWMKFKLERNPIGWLEVRTWSGRLVIWGWFAVMISMTTLAMQDSRLYEKAFHQINSVMAWLLAWSIASSAAGSFRRERETGVLELLLVAPLEVRDIIGGRLRGLWGQFLLPIVLLLGIWVYWAALFEHPGEITAVWFYGVTFVTLPVVGLYFSLISRNFIVALLRTIFVGFVLPILLPVIFKWLFSRLFFSVLLGSDWSAYSRSPEIRFGVGAGLFQVAAAFFFWNRLHANLRERKFSLERAIT